MRDMIFHHKQSFSELKAMPEGIATNILTDRLARLSAVGVVARRDNLDDGRRVVYELTEHGRELVPVLLGLMVWSRQHTKDVDVSMELIRKIESDPSGAALEILQRLDDKSA